MVDALPSALNSSTSMERPAKKRSKIMPISAKTLTISPAELIGSIGAAHPSCPAIKPATDGPIMMPAMSSPKTAGCLILAANIPPAFAAMRKVAK
jgi:hypothetical protein